MLAISPLRCDASHRQSRDGHCTSGRGTERSGAGPAMCGICGVVTPVRSARPALFDLERMADTMIYRGLDSAGSVVSGLAGLVMRRLVIIDVEGGQQPLISEDGR